MSSRKDPVPAATNRLLTAIYEIGAAIGILSSSNLLRSELNDGLMAAVNQISKVVRDINEKAD